jgi:hypothetical protein
MLEAIDKFFAPDITLLLNKKGEVIGAEPHTPKGISVIGQVIYLYGKSAEEIMLTIPDICWEMVDKNYLAEENCENQED